MNNIDWKDPRTIFVLVVAVIVLGGAYCLYDFVWTPFEAQELELQNSISQQDSELSKIAQYKKKQADLDRQLTQSKEKRTQIELEFNKLQEIFPEEEDVSKRLLDLNQVLHESGVQIQKFNPEGRSEKEHYIENRYSISVNAGYHMLGFMFAEIANFKYPTLITDLRMNRYSGIAAELQKAESHGWTPITVSVSFNLTTYISKNAPQKKNNGGKK